jgi:hypothetical protein
MIEIILIRSNTITPNFQELRLLEKFGKQVEGPSFQGVSAWDEAYYTNLMKEQSLGLNARVRFSY